jgi:hypothetical protein
VIESIFTYEGKRNHEIMFLYKGILTNKELYDKEKIRVVDSTYEFDAEWIDIKDVLNGAVKLYPTASYQKYLR